MRYEVCGTRRRVFMHLIENDEMIEWMNKNKEKQTCNGKVNIKREK